MFDANLGSIFWISKKPAGGQVFAKLTPLKAKQSFYFVMQSNINFSKALRKIYEHFFFNAGMKYFLYILYAYLQFIPVATILPCTASEN